MPSKSETGHAKNVANFQTLITTCLGYGVNYNPTKKLIQIPQMQEQQTLAEALLQKVTITNTIYNDVVNNRINIYGNYKKYATRIFNALQTTEATKEKIEDAKTINKKIQGTRAKAIVTPTTTPDPNIPAPTSISVSQQSYDSVAIHFQILLEILKSEPSYTPNEKDLTIQFISEFQANLIQSNKDVATAYVNISNKRIERDKVLYDPTTGLVETATEVKKYILSVFGKQSPEYKQIIAIKFKNRII